MEIRECSVTLGRVSISIVINEFVLEFHLLQLVKTVLIMQFIIKHIAP